MSSSLEKPIKSTVTLVRFLYRSPSVVQHLYCDDASPNPGLGGLYLPAPDMEVEDIEISGLLKEKPARITLPRDTFTWWLSEQRPHPQVLCWVFDKTGSLSLTGGEEPTKTIFIGEVDRATRTPNKKDDYVRIEAVNWKSSLDKKVGLLELNTCVWPLFSPSTHPGSGCTLNKSSFVKTAVIDTVDGKTIIVTDSDITTKTGRWWRSGWVEIGKAHIRIKDWIDTYPTALHLQRQAPSDWQGQSADFYPGCSKLYSSCQTFNNTNNFMGIGHSIPSHQSLMQKPRSG
jgi:hypothetical protein